MIQILLFFSICDATITIPDNYHAILSYWDSDECERSYVHAHEYGCHVLKAFDRPSFNVCYSLVECDNQILLPYLGFMMRASNFGPVTRELEKDCPFVFELPDALHIVLKSEVKVFDRGFVRDCYSWLDHRNLMTCIVYSLEARKYFESQEYVERVDPMIMEIHVKS